MAYMQLLSALLVLVSLQSTPAQSINGSVTILSPPQLMTVYGETLTIVCTAFLFDMDGVASATWGSTAVNADLRNQTDHFDEVEHVDIRSLTIQVDSNYCGEYICTQMTLSATITVDVAPAIVVDPVNGGVGASMLDIVPVNFTCKVRGGPNLPVFIEWMGPVANLHLLPTASIQLNVDQNGESTSTLTLIGINYTYVGEYRCVANYTDPDCSSTSDSNPSSLFIVEAPTIVLPPEPSQLNVTVGSSVLYLCSFNASEASSRLCFEPELANFDVYWVGPSGRKNTTDIPLCDRLSPDEDTVNITLTLTDVNSADGGLYTCVAENIDGSINGSTLLFVNPVIQPTNYTAVVNETLTIVCDVQDYPPPSFVWEKETNISGLFETLIISDGRNLNTTMKNLTFDPIVFGDEGVYRCVVTTDEFGSVPSNGALLTVSPEGGVSVSPLNGIFLSDDNLTLSCEALGGPNNEYNWTVSRNDVTSLGPSSPTFDLFPAQGGVYTCMVSNTAGSGSATTTVFISLRFIIHPNDTLTEIDLRVVFICEAESFPDPTYEWFRSTGDIRSNLTGINTSMLVLDPVLFGDEGDYFCLATSQTNFTLPSQSATLTVSPKGSVTVQPSTLVADFEMSVVFACSSLGGPDNTYQWYKDSQLLAGEDGVNLTISNVTSTDGGEYTCLVMNAAGNDNASSVLYVRPYIVLFPETEITTTAGSVVNFTCRAEGFPQPNITWVKVNDSGRVLVESGEALQFDTVVFGDEGIYACVASSSVPDEVNSTQAPAILTVSPEGSVTVAPVDRVYYFQDNVTFTCSFRGGLNNSILWTKDGRELAGEIEELLSLTGVNSTDGGLYTCTVSNSAGNESASTTLFIAPYFTAHPLNVSADNGTNVNFSCIAESFPMPTYMWIRTDDQAIRAEAGGRNDSLLTYSPVLFGDEGDYYCEATILNITVPSDLATLTLAPEEVNVTAQLVDELFLGENVNLTCSHLGGLDNMYTWFKDGLQLDFEIDPLLALYDIDAADGGNYTCMVSNVAGDSNGSIVLYVQPYTTVFPDGLVTVNNGTSTNLSCEADGFPSPIITWIKYEDAQNRSNFVNVSTGSVLTFEPALFGDEGYYSCVASSLRFDGESLEDVVSDPPSELSVSPAPSVMILAHNSTYFFGDNTTLTCVSLGGPNNSYLWLKDGETVVSETDLELTNISAVDGAEYSCVVSNNAGNDSDQTDLYVHPYIVEAPELSINTMDGDFVSIECIAEGFPAPNVTWERLGLEFGNSGSGMGSDQSALSLEEFDNLPLEFALVSFGDEGYYQCVVSAQTPEGVDLVTVRAEPTLVTVSPEGSVEISPDFQVLERFDNITFMCSSLGGPNNTYQWQKDGIDLINETIPFLTVTNISAQDGGTYSCMVSNTAGNETVDATLFVRPYITLDPVQDILTTAGSNVSFECKAESFPSPRYFWEKIDGNVSVVGDSRVLEFNTVVFGEEGIYQCVAYITANMTNLTETSRSGLLTISPEGGVSSSPPIHNSERNRTVLFTCLSLGGPENNFTWTRLLDGALLSSSPLLEVDVTGEFRGGLYLCDVLNRAGNSSFEVTLNVAPEIAENPVDQNVTIFNSFSLSCGANGYPIPGIVWLLNGTEIQILNNTFFSGSGSGSLVPLEVEETLGLRSIDSTLTISMAMTNDSGNYICRIISSVSDFEEIMTQPALVLVQDVPDPPHSLDAQFVTNTSMVLIWSMPHDNNAPILGYEITYQQPSFLGGDEVKANSSVEMRFFGGLHPGVVYNFTVVAYNEIGVSGPSDLTGFPTLDEEPDSPPPGLITTVESSTSVFLSWQEIEEIDRNGIITTYEVAYTPLLPGCPAIMPGSVNGSGNSTELVVNGLEENTPYNFSVRAYTSAGPGPYGETVMNITLEDVPSGPPENVTASPLSSTELFVQWDPIDCRDQNGEITLYEILYETNNTFNGSIDQIRLINTSNSSIVIANLEENHPYQVIVRGYTSVGPGPYSLPQSATTQQAPPSAPPLNVQVHTVSSTMLLVEWGEVPPIDRNGIITQYEVLYQPLNTFGGLISADNVTELSRARLLTGLEEDVEYNVSVRAYTIMGSGPYSEPVSNVTFMDVPSSPPDNVVVIPLSSNQMRVTWDDVPEIEQNGPIILYGVLYSPNNTFDGQLLKNQSVVTNETSVLLEDLEEFLEYDVSVRAYTEIGPGAYSDPISNITFEAAPSGPVENVIVLSTSSSSIRVLWDEVAPIDQNGIQLFYEIRYQPVTIFRGYDIPEGSNVTDMFGEFVLTNLEEFVEYNISVRSFTSIGPGPFSSAVRNRTAQDAPASPPVNILINVLSSTEVSVQWDDVPDVDQNGVIISYEVLYKPFITFDGRIQTQLVSNFTELSANISGLEEFVQYNMSVRAATIEGYGPYSGDLNFTTEPDLPGSSPLNVNATVLSSTEFLVTWEPPDPIDHNGIINEYNIELSQNTFTENRTRIVPTSASNGVNEMTVGGLEEHVNYSVRVLARNSEGPGPYSGNITETTFEDRPSAPPDSLTILSNGPNNLNISWTRPPEIHVNGEITIFSVQYNMVGSGNTTLFNVSGSTLIAELNGLNNFTNYSVSVAAHTRVGEGPSATEIGRTDENVPGEPPKVTTLRSNSFDSILIEWVPPSEEYLFGILRGFRVRHSNTELSEPNSVSSAIIPNNARSHIIQNLVQFTNYSVEIAAITNGEGVYSNPTIVRTDQDKPSGYPTNIELVPQPSDPRTIKAMWGEVPKNQRNGIILMYEVRFEPLETYGGQIVPRTLNETDTMIDLRDLEEHTPYNVSIRAYTVVGEGPYSPESTVVTAEDVPSAPPPGLAAAVINSRNMTLEWDNITLIHQNGVIISYTIQYSRVDAELTITNILDTDDRQFEATDLTPGVVYSVQIAANTSQGMSEYSEIFVETLEETPGEVDELTKVERFTSITIHWQIPQEPNGVIVNYDVQYNTSLEPVDVSVSGMLSFTRENLQTGQSVTFQVRAFTRIGPGVSKTIHAVTRDKPPQIQNVTVESAADSTTAIVRWNRLTGVDAENVVEYKVNYSFKDENGVEVFRVHNVSAEQNMAIIEDLVTDRNYLYRVSAVARIDTDTIKGDQSDIGLDSFHPIPPTEAHDPLPNIHLGSSIPSTIILTAVVCIIIFVLLIILWKVYQSRRNKNRPTQSLAFEDEGHYESVEMLRRQLPQIPPVPTRSGRSTPGNIRMNLSYRPVTRPEVPGDIYDNDEPVQEESGFDRYSSAPRTPTSSTRRKSSHPKGTVIANTETYDTVVDDQQEQEPQEVYDNDPFDKPQLNFRRDSNPNIYSEVSAQEGQAASQSKKSLDTSMVVRNPAFKAGDRKESVGKSEETPPKSAKKDSDDDGNESAEEYIDMASPVPLLSQSPVKVELREDKLPGKSEAAPQRDSTAATGPSPYLVPSEIDLTESDPAKGDAGISEAAPPQDSTAKPDHAPYFQFDDHYDDIGVIAAQIEGEQDTYMDMSA